MLWHVRCSKFNQNTSVLWELSILLLSERGDCVGFHDVKEEREDDLHQTKGPQGRKEPSGCALVRRIGSTYYEIIQSMSSANNKPVELKQNPIQQTHPSPMLHGPSSRSFLPVRPNPGRTSSIVRPYHRSLSLSPAAESEAEAFFSARKDTSCSQKAQYHREDGELGWDGSGGRESWESPSEIINHFARCNLLLMCIVFKTMQFGIHTCNQCTVNFFYYYCFGYMFVCKHWHIFYMFLVCFTRGKNKHIHQAEYSTFLWYNAKH